MLGDREGEHALEVVDAVGAPLAVRLEDYLGVGRRLEAVPEGPQLLAQLRVVVDAAVEDAGEFAAGVGHRLGPAVRQIDDLQSAVAEGDGAPVPGALPVGAAPLELFIHAFDSRRIGRPAVETDLPAQPAHAVTPPFRASAAARDDGGTGARPAAAAPAVTERMGGSSLFGDRTGAVLGRGAPKPRPPPGGASATDDIRGLGARERTGRRHDGPGQPGAGGPAAAALAAGLGDQHVDAAQQVLAACRAAHPAGRGALGEGFLRQLADGPPVAVRLQRGTQPQQQLADDLARGGLAVRLGVDQGALQAGAGGPPGRAPQPLVPAGAARVPRLRSRARASVTRARNSPAISTTVSARGQASQMRSSRVRRWSEGRTS